MPRQNGFLKMQGALGDLSFYKTANGFFIRTKGGINKKQFYTAPSLKRTRENIAEFCAVSKAGKLLRVSNATFIRKAYDGTLNTRLNQVLTKVKNCDLISARGQRNIANGIATPEGKALLRGFDFNIKAPLHSVFFAPYLLEISTGTLSANHLDSAYHFNAPAHATHAILQTAFIHVDFAIETSEASYSAVAVLPIDEPQIQLSLTPAFVPAVTGTLFYFLLVEFRQEINGIKYVLNDQSFNSLHLIEIL